MTVLCLARPALIASIAWGAFTFGAVLPWAYWPLCGSALAIGLAGLSAVAPPLPRVESPFLAVSLALFLCASIAQAVPLPADWLARLSPHTAPLLSAIDLSSQDARMKHSLSILPWQTLKAAIVIAALCVLLLGCIRLITLTGPAWIAVALSALGVILAVVGLAQQALYNGKLLGFWQTKFESSPFGPFANHNHFAGWMLMAIPLTMGLLFGEFARSASYVRPGWRHRMIWLGSREANMILLLGAATTVMSLSVVMTMSRSGIAGLVLALLILFGRVFFNLEATRQRLIVLLTLTVIGAGILIAIGPHRVASIFLNADWASFNQRKGPWLDALSVIREFPIAGTGLNTYGAAMLVYQRHALDLHYAQAHNDYLQLAAEGGALLVLPLLAAVVATAVTIRHRFSQDRSRRVYWLRLGAVAALAAIALQELVDFSLQMPGNAFLFAVVCAMAVHRAIHPAPTRQVPTNS